MHLLHASFSRLCNFLASGAPSAANVDSISRRGVSKSDLLVGMLLGIVLLELVEFVESACTHLTHSAGVRVYGLHMRVQVVRVEKLLLTDVACYWGVAYCTCVGL